MDLQKKVHAGRVAAASIAIATLAGSLHAQATEQWQVSPTVGTTTQRWGFSMDEKGGVLVCGAPYDDTKAADAGAATVYRFDATTNSWAYEAQLFASDFEAGARFGTSVGVDGALIVVGAPYKDTTKGTDGGQFYVFRYDATNKVWNQEQKLLPSVGATNDYFGTSIDISGNGVVVGSPRYDSSAGTDAGAAFVFRYQNPFVKWVEEKLLADPDGTYGDYAGHSVAIEGGTVAVSSINQQEGSAYGAGTVGIWTVSGTTWTQVQEIVSPTPQYYAGFGSKLRMRGSLLGICAPTEDYSASIIDSGNAYLYELSSGSFVLEKQFSPKSPASYTNFGNDIDVSDDLVVVGFQNDTVSGKSAAGSAHLFRKGKKSGWVYDVPLGASDFNTSDRFGAQVVLASGNILVSADGNDTTAGSDWGVVYGFDDSEIVLTASPTQPAPGQTITFEAFRGIPGDVVMVTINEVNHSPFFMTLLVYVFAADSTLTFTADAPNPLYGINVGMAAWKLSPTGPVVVSEIVNIDV